jgi:uncharacterized membrane protein YhiD involved in acid resistance
MADINLNALGEAIDTSWGRSSSPVIGGFAVNMTLAGQNQLILTYQTMVNFSSEHEMHKQKQFETEQASRNVKTVVDSVKKKYKDLTGSTLKLKESKSSDSLEIIGMNIHTPQRRALYRKKCVFEIA